MMEALLRPPVATANVVVINHHYHKKCFIKKSQLFMVDGAPGLSGGNASALLLPLLKKSSSGAVDLIQAEE